MFVGQRLSYEQFEGEPQKECGLSWVKELSELLIVTACSLILSEYIVQLEHRAVSVYIST